MSAPTHSCLAVALAHGLTLASPPLCHRVAISSATLVPDFLFAQSRYVHPLRASSPCVQRSRRSLLGHFWSCSFSGTPFRASSLARGVDAHCVQGAPTVLAGSALGHSPTNSANCSEESLNCGVKKVYGRSCSRACRKRRRGPASVRIRQFAVWCARACRQVECCRSCHDFVSRRDRSTRLPRLLLPSHRLGCSGGAPNPPRPRPIDQRSDVDRA